ncbi:hypothetical protein GH5_08569 [Leishmania sp. Ghana 2012 LV757]|uniref:uncharacterized protein n=1 Tax=Leishmania sp. Ghana 2012 LV757 TaxID=2803181 RepID=UPI001B670F38|nr:hypothetical protein GH5_08569 [Leishmania sp. Ghana 2012 LV757]
MDVIPPEYDSVTRERVYRQEWLEYFHYIGFEAAIRDHPAEYRALFPRGHHKPPAIPPPLPVGGTTPQTAPTSAAEAKMFIADDDDMTGMGSDADESWSSLISSSSTSEASIPRDSPRENARAERVERTARDERISRRPTSSRHDDRHLSSRRHRDRESDERRRRQRSDEDDRRHRHRHHSSRGSDHHHTSASGSSRRRRRSGDRDDRRSSRLHGGEESSRRYRRETASSGSRSHAYEDRREDALRRRENAYRR